MTSERALALAHLGRFDAAHGASARDPSDRGRHVLAYIAAARGRFGDALTLCRAITSRGAAPFATHHAFLTAASVLRQMGRHDEARSADVSAHRLAPDAAGRAHASIGLAADAVGRGDADRCASMLAEAGACAPAGDWRVAVRLGWVLAEHAMLRDRPAHAAEAAGAAAALSRRAGAVRHEAKSLLFLGAAMAAAGDERAARTLSAAGTIATRIGAAPIAHVARALLEGGQSPHLEHG